MLHNSINLQGFGWVFWVYRIEIKSGRMAVLDFKESYCWRGGVHGYSCEDGRGAQEKLGIIYLRRAMKLNSQIIVFENK